jgi:hypothetical protein
VDATIVRSISREYRIRTSSPELAPYLTFLSARPEMEDCALVPVELAAEAAADGFRLMLAGQEAHAPSAMQAANRIFEAILTAVRDEAFGAPLAHGASLIHQGRRLIVVGPKASGKSTLTLFLLAHGFEVEGDEHVVVRETDLIARPRRIHVKPGSLPLVPELTQAILASPYVAEPIASPVYAVDPGVAGRPWRIRPGRADHIVFLEANHGGRSMLAPVGADEAFRGLTEDCLLPDQKIVGLARLRRLAQETRTWRLSLGDLNEAEDRLRDLLT